MAKARVRLKDLNNSLRRLTKEVNTLKGRGADAAAKKGLRTLHQSLTKAQKLMAAQCPETQFRDFEIAEQTATKRKKTTRKTRKAT